MSENHKKILEQANAAISEGDFDGFLAWCTDDTEWRFVGDRTLKGKEAVRQWMADTYKQPPKFRVSRMIAEHDAVVVLGQITLKDEEGKATEYAYCDVWRFDGDRMAALQAFVLVD